MNLKKKFHNQYILVCIFIISIIFTMIVGLIGQINNIRYYKQQIYTLEKEIDTVEEKIDKYKVCKFRDEDERIEYLARTKLGMIKRNEIIYLEK